MPVEIRYAVSGLMASYERDEMRDLIRKGRVTSATSVAIAGTEDWKDASAYPELKRYLDLAASMRKNAPAAKMPSIGLALWRGIGIILGGALLLIFGLVDVVQGLASQRWPSVPAYVSSIDTVEGIYSWEKHGGFRGVYVGFDYRIDGKRHTASNLAYGRELASIVAPRHFAKSFFDGSPIAAYYDPAHPTRAVLHPGVTFEALLDVSLGLVIVFWGVFVARQKPAPWREYQDDGSTGQMKSWFRLALSFLDDFFDR